MKSSNNLSERKPPWPFKRPTNKCGVICIVLGILFLLNAMLSTFFRLPLSDFLGMYENIFKSGEKILIIGHFGPFAANSKISCNIGPDHVQLRIFNILCLLYTSPSPRD